MIAWYIHLMACTFYPMGLNSFIIYIFFFSKILLQYTCLLLFFVYNRLSNLSVILWLSPSMVIGLQMSVYAEHLLHLSVRSLLRVPHLLWHGTSVHTVFSEGPDPTSHVWIRTRNVRIIRSLHRRANHIFTNLLPSIFSSHRCRCSNHHAKRATFKATMHKSKDFL
jgi:hypothetical protein